MDMSLVLIVDGTPVHRMPVRFTLDLGRSGSSDLVLLDPAVSHHHARVSVFGRRAEIRDMGSANGTFVNGERVVRRKLDNGDQLRLGPRATLTVESVPNSGPQALVLEREDGQVRVAVRDSVTHLDGHELTRVPDIDAVFVGDELLRLGEEVRLRGTAWRLVPVADLDAASGTPLPYRLEQDRVGPEIVDLARPGRKVRLTRPTTQRLVRAMCELAPDGGWVDHGQLMDAVWGDRSRPNRLYLNLYRFRRKLEQGGLDPAAVESQDGRVRLHIEQFQLEQSDLKSA